jgi:hypothetical protein
MLEAEARLFGHYLLGRTPPDELIRRYADANRVLFVAAPSPRDVVAVAFVHRHPWSVSLLDAAAGLLDPGGLLRSKILLMAAILEASPSFAAEFLPRSPGTVALVARLAVLGALAVARAAIGVPLYTLVTRGRR